VATCIKPYQAPRHIFRETSQQGGGPETERLGRFNTRICLKEEGDSLEANGYVERPLREGKKVKSVSRLS